MSEPLYFAYGSNLNDDDWNTWCAAHGYASGGLLKPVGKARLLDHDLAFNYKSKSRGGGVLSVVARLGQLVPGVLFEVDKEGWDALKQKEGEGKCYDRQSAWAITEEGRIQCVKTYVIRPEKQEKFVKPTPEYLDIARRGCELHGLPTTSLEAAARGEVPPLYVDALFAYGTLMRGESRFPILKQFSLECALLAQTRGRLIDLGPYPGMQPTDSGMETVQGEFFRIQDLPAAFEKLDEVESFQGYGEPGSQYRRSLVMADVGDGRMREAWTYLLEDSEVDEPIILNGDWRRHQGRRESFLGQLVDAHTGGDEARIARALAQRPPFNFEDQEDKILERLLPLARAVDRGEVSERRLAQESGNWAALT